MATSYANSEGTGNRTTTITVTGGTFAGASAGSPSVLVDGLFDKNIWFSGASAITFQFLALGSPRVIDEAKFYQELTTTHGTWKWQGSNNGSTWTDIGGTFVLGGATVQTITTLAGNTIAYSYYRIILVSGSTSSSPFIYEFEFKIDALPPTVGIRTTQDVVEVLALPVPAVRVTQDVVEVLSFDPGTAVPNLIGQTEAAATTALNAAGFIKGIVRYSGHPTVAAGLVCAHNPAAGVVLPAGISVDLTISTGPTGVRLVASVFASGDTVGSPFGGASLPIDTTGANFLVVWVAAAFYWGKLSDSKNNVWIECPRHNDGNTLGRFYYCTGATVGPNHIFYIGTTVNYPVWSVYAFFGNVAFQGDIGSVTDVGGTVSSGSITPSANNALVLTGYSGTGGPLSVTPVEFTTEQNVPGPNAQYQSGSAYLIQTTAAPINPTWKYTGTVSASLAVTVVFVPVASVTAVARVSQLPVEVLVLGAPVVAQVSQAAVEVLMSPPPPDAYVSQVAVEVMMQPASTLPAKVSQVAVEVMVLYDGSASGGVRGPFMGDMSGGIIWIE